MGFPVLQIRKLRHKLVSCSLPSCHKTKQSIRVSISGLSGPRPGYCPLCLHGSPPPSSEANLQTCHCLDKVREQRLQGPSTGWVFPLLLLLGCRPRGSTRPHSAGLGMCPVALPLPSLLCPQAPPGPQLPKSQPEHHFPRTLANLERQGVPRQGNERIVAHQRERAAPSSGAGAKVPGGDIFKQSISHY